MIPLDDTSAPPIEEWLRQRRVETLDAPGGTADAGQKKGHGFKLLDPREWTEPAPPREWLVPQWIPRGEVTALYGDGGVGKTLLAQQLLSCVGLGLPWLGLEITKGHALGIMCEDTAQELHRRQDAINQLLECDPEGFDDVRYVSRRGEDNIIMTFDGRDVGMHTEVFAGIESLCEDFRPDILVLDTIADLFGGNENNRSQVRQFVQSACGRLAMRFNCAVLLCGHPSVAGMASGAGTGGSTAWNNSVRSRLYLTRPEGDDVHPDARLLSRKKANYAPRDAQVSIMWDQGAFRLLEEGQAQEQPDWSALSALLDMIEEGWRKREPWSNAPQTRRSGRYLPSVAAKRISSLSEKQANRYIIDWIEHGHVSIEEVDSHSKKSGLRVLRRFDRGA